MNWRSENHDKDHGMTFSSAEYKELQQQLNHWSPLSLAIISSLNPDHLKSTYTKKITLIQGFVAVVVFSLCPDCLADEDRHFAGTFYFKFNSISCKMIQEIGQIAISFRITKCNSYKKLQLLHEIQKAIKKKNVIFNLDFTNREASKRLKSNLPNKMELISAMTIPIHPENYRQDLDLDCEDNFEGISKFNSRNYEIIPPIYPVRRIIVETCIGVKKICLWMGTKLEKSKNIILAAEEMESVNNRQK